MKTITLGVLAALALSACASGPSEPRVRGIAQFEGDPRLGEEVNDVCFAASIDGFSMNTRDTVLLHEGRDRFLIEVSPGCRDLDFAEAIALDTTLACLSRGDSIIVSSPSDGGFGPQRCMIREIRKWDPKAEKPEATAEENPA